MGMEDNAIYEVHSLDSLWLVLTYKCQFHCPWCYAQNGALHQDMEFNDAVAACRLHAALGGKHVIFVGGEPLLHRNLCQIVSECKKLRLQTILITNGFLLHEENRVSALKKAGIDRITVSLHRNVKTDFEELVGRKDAYDNVHKGIYNLKKQKIPFEISCVIDTERIEIYFNLVNWAISKGIPTVLFLTYVPLAGSSTVQPMTLFPRQSARLVETIYTKFSTTSDIVCHFVFQYPFCLLSKDIYASMAGGGVLFGSHALLYTGRGLVIDPLGNVLPGSHWVGYPLFHLNDIRENGTLSSRKFLEHWNSEKVINFRKNLWYYASPECEECKLWENSCTGGNPLAWQVWQEEDLLPLQKPFAFPKNDFFQNVFYKAQNDNCLHY